MKEFFKGLFSQQYQYLGELLVCISKFCLGMSVFFAIDLLFQSGLLGSEKKEKWINFINSKYSTYIIFIFGTVLYIIGDWIFQICEIIINNLG